MKLSEKMRKRTSVNVPVGGQRLYAWIEEVAKLEAEIENLKKEAEPFQAQINQRKTYKAFDEQSQTE